LRRRRFEVRQLAAAFAQRGCSHPHCNNIRRTASKLAWKKAAASCRTPKRFALPVYQPFNTTPALGAPPLLI
jgi:hypothetical protein